ncbi:MAG: SPFH domain-containing protein [Lentisphaeria bacterium]|nr:SPFH domain-containing protein [Lentisphaeria bacterium]
MGILDRIRAQFIDVIEWVDESRETLVWKFPRADNEIKNGAQLIVRESQAAVFLHEGELGDVFGPGRVQLTTSNIPILTTLKSWKYAFNAPFKCDIYFVNTRQFTEQKWGTSNPIMLRDAEFGPLRLRAFGTYAYRVSEPGAFIRQLAGTDPNFQAGEVAGHFRSMLISRFADALGEAKIPALDLAANYTEIGDTLLAAIQAEFDDYGVQITKFLIENISLPETVEQALDKRASMGVLGNMGQYTQYQTAQAIGDMAKNPGSGGGMMGMIAGLNVGGMMGGAMQQASAQAQQQPPPPPGAPPPLPQTQWYVAVQGQQAGPYPQQTLQQYVASGQVTAATMVWRQGMSGWQAAGEIPELRGLFGPPPPPPPPPPQA